MKPRPRLTAWGQALMLGLVLMLGLNAAVAQAGNRWSAANHGHRLSLLELYTSQGCSSCPPADRWLRSLAATGHVPTQVVPLAFHVDYWDRLGWTDRYASNQYSQRQRERSRKAGVGVYTPQFLLNGRAFIDTRAIVDELGQAATDATNLQLALDVRYEDGSLVIDPHVDGNGRSSAVDTELYLAVFENGLVSEITAGENRGKVLHHDYVVRHLYGPINTGASSPAGIRVKLDRDWNPSQLGVAAFVQQSGSGRVLQALGLRLTGLRP